MKGRTMKHISKRQFDEHGWKRGDHVRVKRDDEELIVALNEVNVNTRVVWHIGDVTGYFYRHILEIIPRKSSKSTNKQSL